LLFVGQIIIKHSSIECVGAFDFNFDFDFALKVRPYAACSAVEELIKRRKKIGGSGKNCKLQFKECPIQGKIDIAIYTFFQGYRYRSRKHIGNSYR